MLSDSITSARSAASPEKNRAPGPPIHWVNRHSMKVVMVDDSPADRKLCRILLEEAHGSELEFFEESAAAQGLETCRTVRPDCVLLDYMLPDMTGLEFLKSLCSDQPVDSPGFAVVVLTGLASEQVAVEAMKAGAQDYLVKDRITAEGLGMAIEKATEKVPYPGAQSRARPSGPLACRKGSSAQGSAPPREEQPAGDRQSAAAEGEQAR